MRNRKKKGANSSEVAASRLALKARYSEFETQRGHEPLPHENRQSSEDYHELYKQKASYRFDPSTVSSRQRGPHQKPVGRSPRDSFTSRHRDPLAFPHRDPMASRRRDASDPGSDNSPYGSIGKHQQARKAKGLSPGRDQINKSIPVLTKSGVKKPSQRPSSQPSPILLPFSAPPLLPGFIPCLREICESNSPTPTHIQSLAINHVLEPLPCLPTETAEFKQFLQDRETAEYKQYLLASETGSGKSIAYMLPVLQSVKLNELTSNEPTQENTPINPRAIILAPTHELVRQLSTFAKSLLHEVKLRVVCGSKENVAPRSGDPSGWTGRKSARRMKDEVDMLVFGTPSNSHVRRDADVLVATPMKALEMLLGRGWERAASNPLREPNPDDETSSRGWTPSKPEMGTSRLEWVIIDEADVMFDPDFQATTRLLLSTLSKQRDIPIPFVKESLLSKESLNLHKSYSADTISNAISTASMPLHRSSTAGPLDNIPPTPALSYPFNLVLSSATIPSSLSTYLSHTHPKMARLESNQVHRLPNGLKAEFVTYSPGQKNKEVESTLRKIWNLDYNTQSTSASDLKIDFSKVLIFANKSSKVDELGAHLSEKGIKNVALTSGGESRNFGNNKHLDGFLKLRKGRLGDTSSVHVKESEVVKPTSESTDGETPMSKEPHVLITTSLLSRGLDFGDRVRYVFILDEPRNMIDFIHRAGRTARLKNKGTVMLFGKGSSSAGLKGTLGAYFANTSSGGEKKLGTGQFGGSLLVKREGQVLRGTRLGEVRKKVLGMM